MISALIYIVWSTTRKHGGAVQTCFAVPVLSSKTEDILSHFWSRGWTTILQNWTR